MTHPIPTTLRSSRDDVTKALRILRAGVPGQHPAIDDETTAVWHEFVGSHLGVDITEAALNLAERMTEFPAMSEFLAEVQGCARRRAVRDEAVERARASGEPACLHCDGLGNVFTEGPVTSPHGAPVVDGEGQPIVYSFVHPCPVCAPVDHAYWAGGHEQRGHNVEACEHPRCKARRRPGLSRRR